MQLRSDLLDINPNGLALVMDKDAVMEGVIWELGGNEISGRQFMF